jgi:hypothetical protein
MKFSKETLAVLKNYSSINSNILLKEGKELSTISPEKSTVSRVSISEEFPQEFGIYDLGEFLGLLSLFEDPEITFNGKYVTISQGKNSIKYYAADESVLVYVKKFPKLEAPEIEFKIEAANLASISKTASVLKTNDVAFIGDGSTIKVVVGDKKNPTANNYELEIGETDKTFKVYLNTDNLKLIPNDFKVGIVNRRLAEFTTEASDLTYYIAIEAESTFE